MTDSTDRRHISGRRRREKERAESDDGVEESGDRMMIANVHFGAYTVAPMLCFTVGTGP